VDRDDGEAHTPSTEPRRTAFDVIDRRLID